MIVKAAPVGTNGSVALLMVAALGIGGCRAEPPPGNSDPQTENVSPDVPAAPVAMDRKALLMAVAEAASAASAGIADQKDQSALDGRQFEFRIPFGCPADDSILDRNLKLAVRPDGKAYEASATPDISLVDVPEMSVPVRSSPTSQDKSSPGGKAPTIEAAEGFWVRRPWQFTAGCPVPLAAPPERDATPPVDSEPAASVSRPTVGLVQYYATGDSRVGYRDGRPLTKIETIGAANPAPTSGMAMILSGRLREWPDGKVVRCTGGDPDRAPTCLVSAAIDRIAFERLDDGALIAEWTR